MCARAAARDAAALGADAGRELKGRAGPGFFRAGLNVRLLLTRPEPDAARTAAALRARGHEPIVAPLLAIEIVSDADLGAGPWAAILVTSANAVRAIAGRISAATNCAACPCSRSASGQRASDA